MQKILRLIQNLSLDVTAGAIVSSLFVCRLFGVVASVEMMTGLGIAIWLIYTTDHLLDARKLKIRAINPRHAFHQKYFNPIASVAVLVFGIGIYNTFSLPPETVKLGLILGVLCGVYFLYLQWNKTGKHKEFFAATVYTAGIFTAPVSQLADWDLLYVITFIQFFLLASINLMLFPLFELDLDNSEEVNSIATRQGVKVIQKRSRALVLTLLSLIIVMTGLGYNERGAQFILLIMCIMLLAMLIRPEAFAKKDLYRLIGDGIFVIPGIYLL